MIDTRRDAPNDSRPRIAWLSILVAVVAALASMASAAIAWRSLGTYRNATLYSQRIETCSALLDAWMNLSEKQSVARRQLYEGGGAGLPGAGPAYRVAVMEAAEAKRLFDQERLRLLFLNSPAANNAAIPLVNLATEWQAIAEEEAPSTDSLATNSSQSLAALNNFSLACREG